MTEKKAHVIFYLILGVCLLVIVLPFTLFAFVEVEPAVDWTLRYCALPTFIATIPVCSYAYIRFIQQFERKNLKSKIWIQLRTVLRIFTLIVAMTMIFIGTTLSLIVLTNASIGTSQKIHLNATIVNYHTSKNKGRMHQYIKIKDPQLKRIIELKVHEKYQVGDTLKKTVYLGRWGLVYAKR